MLLMVYNVGNKWIISVNKWNVLFKKMDDWSAAQKQWIEILFKHSIHFFFLSFFSLHVSVSFPSCVISPVSLFLVSDTRVSNVPRPGCRTCRDPDVEHAETRVLNMSRPGCQTMPFRISVFSFSLPLFLSARMRIYYNVFLFSSLSPLCLYLRKICSSTRLSISVL